MRQRRPPSEGHKIPLRSDLSGFASGPIPCVPEPSSRRTALGTREVWEGWSAKLRQQVGVLRVNRKGASASATQTSGPALLRHRGLLLLGLSLRLFLCASGLYFGRFRRMDGQVVFIGPRQFFFGP